MPHIDECDILPEKKIRLFFFFLRSRSSWLLLRPLSRQHARLTFRGNVSAQETQLHPRLLNTPGLQYGFAANIKFSEDLLCHSRKKMRVVRAPVWSKVQLLGLRTELASHTLLIFTLRKQPWQEPEQKTRGVSKSKQQQSFKPLPLKTPSLDQQYLYFREAC